MKIHQFSVEEALRSLRSNSEGLSADEALRRLQEFGPNRMERIAGDPAWLRLFKEFTRFFSVILWVAGSSPALPMRCSIARRVATWCSTSFAGLGTTMLAAEKVGRAPNHAFAHCVLGSAHIFTNRAAQGIAECEHALALDRNLAVAHALIGLTKNALRRAEEAEGHILEALRLSPRDTVKYTWMAMAGAAKLQLGSDDEAVVCQRRSIEANRNFPFAHCYLAAALAHLSRLDEARAAAQAGLALDPNFTIGRARAGAMSDNPTYLEQRERVYDGTRMAGIPEG
jgi:tetratricopeptide (TPR) repeat protein